MAKNVKPALIGDANSSRFNWLKSVLDSEFGMDAVQAEIFDKLQKLVEESNEARRQVGSGNTTQHCRGENSWSFIAVADDLPERYTLYPTEYSIKKYFTSLGILNKCSDFNTVLINTQDFQIDWRASDPPDRTITISPELTSEDSQGLVTGLDKFAGLERLASIEDKLTWDTDNRILRKQIRALSDRRNVQDGQRQLARLISRCVKCSGVKKVEVRQLGQGKSGSSVFRFVIERASRDGSSIEEREFVLKVFSAEDLWKLTSEVQCHLLASPELGHPGYKSHLPQLERASVPCDLSTQTFRNLHIVRSAHWYAVHFDFLGGDRLGEFVDLEAVVIGPGKDLRKKIQDAGSDLAAGSASIAEVRMRVLKMLLEWLTDNWYANVRAGNVRREMRVPWTLGNADERKNIVVPPYELTGRAKGWIQSFLDSPEAEIGERFFSDWHQHMERVSRLVGEDESANKSLGQLGDQLPVLLSHVHGDLNANNVLLWLKHKHPFLIDFPFYQEAGHALQDFARLEVEIKFALLDRQKDSPEKKLKAFEHTYSQMPLWREMELRLVDCWDQPAAAWSSKGYNKNVKLSFELVRLIRQKALGVQQNVRCDGPPPGDFLQEYWPALLYHTVRAIGYPSLSLFKRLLAVYSAGSILSKVHSFDN